MRLILTTLIAGVFIAAGPSYANPVVKMKTTVGTITIELFEEEAAETVANFLRYVDEGRYEKAAFYRVVRDDNQPGDKVKIGVIQGGISRDAPDKALPPIFHETTEDTGIWHKDGMISMARLEPGTASSEFFICVGDQPELDFGGKRNLDGQGFAAFGQVIKGMFVVRRIQKRPAAGQYLKPKIFIKNITRIN